MVHEANKQCSTTYNRINNKFTFTRIYTQDANYFNMYIKPINCGSFLGLNNNVEYLVTSGGNIGLYPINVVTIKAISIVLMVIYHLKIIIWKV